MVVHGGWGRFRWSAVVRHPSEVGEGQEVGEAGVKNRQTRLDPLQCSSHRRAARRRRNLQIRPTAAAIFGSQNLPQRSAKVRGIFACTESHRGATESVLTGEMRQWQNELIRWMSMGKRMKGGEIVGKLPFYSREERGRGVACGRCLPL
jgi:hypothetical protein